MVRTAWFCRALGLLTIATLACGQRPDSTNLVSPIPSDLPAIAPALKPGTAAAIERGKGWATWTSPALPATEITGSISGERPRFDTIFALDDQGPIAALVGPERGRFYSYFKGKVVPDSTIIAWASEAGTIDHVVLRTHNGAFLFIDTNRNRLPDLFCFPLEESIWAILVRDEQNTEFMVTLLVDVEFGEYLAGGVFGLQARVCQS